MNAWPWVWVWAPAGVVAGLVAAALLAMARMRLRLAAQAAFPTGMASGSPAGLRVAATGRVAVGPLCLSFRGRARLGGAPSRAVVSATLWAGPARLVRVRLGQAAPARSPLCGTHPGDPAPVRPEKRAPRGRAPDGIPGGRLPFARHMLGELVPHLSWQRLDVSLLLGAGDARTTALGAAALNALLAAAVARLVGGAGMQGRLRLHVWPDFRRTALAARVDVAVGARPIWVAAAALQGWRVLRARRPPAPCRPATGAA